MEDNTSKDIVADLCATPRFKPGGLPRCATALTDEWVEPVADYPRSPWGLLNGASMEAAIYLGHLATVQIEEQRGKGMRMTHILQRAIEHNPELIVMAARMKKLMAS